MAKDFEEFYLDRRNVDYIIIGNCNNISDVRKLLCRTKNFGFYSTRSRALVLDGAMLVEVETALLENLKNAPSKKEVYESAGIPYDPDANHRCIYALFDTQRNQYYENKGSMDNWDRLKDYKRSNFHQVENKFTYAELVWLNFYKPLLYNIVLETRKTSDFHLRYEWIGAASGFNNEQVNGIHEGMELISETIYWGEVNEDILKLYDLENEVIEIPLRTDLTCLLSNFNSE